jgi:hypothetical protein
MTTRPRAFVGRHSSIDAAWKAVELAQRGRMILDVATADLEESEARLGPFHTTSWFFRNALAEARNAWDRLRAEYGTASLEAALEEPPVTTLRIDHGGSAPILLVPIRGRTYRVERVPGTTLAPVQLRLTRLPPVDDGPYYACLLADGTTQCDCAEWAYQVEGTPRLCKHLEAMQALGWLRQLSASDVSR